jgi:hypothetical protein
MRTWTFAAVVLVGLGASGCGATLVKSRAAEDLHCPASQLTVVDHEMNAYEVRGCGKQANYLVRGGEVMPDSGGGELAPDLRGGGE